MSSSVHCDTVACWYAPCSLQVCNYHVITTSSFCHCAGDHQCGTWTDQELHCPCVSWFPLHIIVAAVAGTNVAQAGCQSLHCSMNSCCAAVCSSCVYLHRDIPPLAGVLQHIWSAQYTHMCELLHSHHSHCVSLLFPLCKNVH